MAEASATQIFNFYYTRLLGVISQKNPTGIQDVGALLKQFPGKEYQVYVQICRKLGVQPEKEASPEELANNSTGKISSWLIENGYKKYADLQGFMAMKWGNFLAISTEEQLKELGVTPQDSDSLLRSILSEVCETAKEVELPKTKSEVKEPTSDPEELEQKFDFKVGEICFTRVLKIGNKDGKEKWVSARVTNINKNNNTFDVFVINAKAHGVPPEAVNVPRGFLKKSSDYVREAVLAPQGVIVPKYQAGDRVRVVGLRSHTLYNGLSGTILLYIASERRYQVRLDTSDLFAIRERNISPDLAELPKEAIEIAKKKVRKAGITDQAQQDALVQLMDKLFRRSPVMDHSKFGEFAAGYFIAKQKIMSDQGK